MYNEIGGRPDKIFTCDLCDAQEYADPTEQSWVRIYRYEDGQDICGSCLREEFRNVDDLVLAFYPELAKHLSQDPYLLASAGTLDLPFDEVQGVKVIRSREKLANFAGDDRVNVNMMVFTGSIQGEFITFKANSAFTRIMVPSTDLVIDEVDSNPNYRPITQPISIFKEVNTEQSDFAWNPAVVFEHLWDNADWQTDTSRFRYNVYDEAGMNKPFEWAVNTAKEWLRPEPRQIRSKRLR